jgi:hypothetical protein
MVLKGTVGLWLFHKSNSYEHLNHIPNYFRIRSQIRGDIQIRKLCSPGIDTRRNLFPGISDLEEIIYSKKVPLLK